MKQVKTYEMRCRSKKQFKKKNNKKEWILKAREMINDRVKMRFVGVQKCVGK